MSRASRRANRESAIRAHNAKDSKDFMKRTGFVNRDKRSRVDELIKKYSTGNGEKEAEN